ncbi:MAG: hypothetical protein ACYCZN_01465 [Candidatus Dormibacteria bacterium]
MAEMQKIRERHCPVAFAGGVTLCQDCADPWPCDAAIALDRNRQLELLAMEWDGFAEMAHPLGVHQEHRFERCAKAREAIGALEFWQGDGTDDAAN